MFLASLFEPVNHTLSLYPLLADTCSTPVFLFRPGFLGALCAPREETELGWRWAQAAQRLATEPLLSLAFRERVKKTPSFYQ